MPVKTRSESEYKKRIDDALDYLSEHLSEKINLEKLALKAYFSPFHFHRIFVSVLGETPNNYITRLRLEKAANMLYTQKGVSITEIALQCGFSSSAVFARSFKKHFGIPARSFAAKCIGDYHAIKYGRPQNDKAEEVFDFSKIQIKRLPELSLICARSNHGYGKSNLKLWEKIIKFAAFNDLITADTRFIGIPFDNPGITPENKCRYYACISKPEGFEYNGREFRSMEIEAGRYAVYHFTGKEEEISKTYSFLYGKWLPQSGYALKHDFILEVYPRNQQVNNGNGIFDYDIALPVKLL
jgi:AraC family transcriptional regulator